MKFFLVMLSVVFTSMLAADDSVMTSQPGQYSQEGLRSVYISPCDSWMYSNEVQGYVCRYRSHRISVPDSYDIQNIENKMNEMSRKIKELESRIQALEQQ